MRTHGLLSLRSLSRALILGLLLLNVGCCCCGDGRLLNRMGMRQYKRGNYAQARHHFAKAIARNPCNPDYRHNLAMALQKQGDPMSAEQIFRHNLTIDAMHQPTYHALALNLISQGRPTEAKDLMMTWAETQPYLPESNIELAWVLRSTGDPMGAQQALQNALQTDPANPIALAHLGQLYQDGGQNDQAVSYYERSLAAKWDQPEVQSRLATMTEPRRMRRSALIQNSSASPMVAGGPIINQPMLAGMPPEMTGPQSVMTTALPFGDAGQAIALEDVSANPRPRRSTRRTEKEKQEAAMMPFPLPTYGDPQMAWAPTGTIVGQSTMAYQPNGIEMGMNPQIVGAIAPPGPIVMNGQPQMIASGPTPLGTSDPNQITLVDPAHTGDTGTDVTASLPVVDPH